MRILLVSQFWPGRDDPDLGVFVAQVARELEHRSHEVHRAVVDHRRPGRGKHPRLVAEAVRAARAVRPHVVFGHFLVPAGVAAAAAAGAARAPLVVMAHGQDVANVGAIPGVRAATAAVVARAEAVICNSAYLRDELRRRLPRPARPAPVIDCGVDLRRFAPRDRAAARAALRLPAEGPLLLYVGALIERKNVVRLRDAFEALGRGTLVVVGDGPLRGELEERERIVLAGRHPHDRVPDWIAACDVLCLPSLLEPLGQVLLEAMAMERTVLSTTVGGPPELVPPGAGVLVDPSSRDAIRAGLERALALPSPNPAAREAASRHDARLQAERMEGVLLDAATRRR